MSNTYLYNNNIDVEPQKKGCYDIEDLDLPQNRIRSFMGLVSTDLERIYLCYVIDTNSLVLLLILRSSAQPTLSKPRMTFLEMILQLT